MAKKINFYQKKINLIFWTYLYIYLLRFAACNNFNPFGSWNGEGAKGISYNSAEKYEYTSNMNHDNLDYVAFLIRNFNSNGDVINTINLNGGYTDHVCTICDHSICATCLHPKKYKKFI